MKCPAGFPAQALDPSNSNTFGLDRPVKPAGSGDERILQAVECMRELKREGKTRLVGICGYPLPILLRAALMVLDVTGEPIDVVQTYGHQTLMNDTLATAFLKEFTGNAKVRYVTNASPLQMGFLTTAGRAPWQTAQAPIEAARLAAVDICRQEGVSLEEVACNYGYKQLYQSDGTMVPIVLGCKSLEELQSSLASFVSAVQGGRPELKPLIERLRKLFEEMGVLDYSWG